MLDSLILIFFLLHILADFYFQTQNLADNKKENFIYVIYHSIIYFLTMFLIFIFYKFNLSLFLATGIIGLSHFIIDLGKSSLSNKKFIKESSLFMVDQLIHISILIGFYIFIKNTDLTTPIERWNLNSSIVYLNSIIALLLIFKPANILIKSFISDSSYNSEEEIGDRPPLRLGKIIGNLERILIVLLLCVNQYVVIGYIFIAKSIARWKKLTEDKDFAEYYLVGTLLSVIISIIVYFIFLQNIKIF
ncbi:MAG: DUF3307 domain-containing protein [Sphaerochaetaceae bacterium]|nr:DUF3307 domain-containing protein [Sphaerochaetaceae bacterium]